MSGRCFQFTHAVCRTPAASVTAGLRAENRGDPDPDRFAREHAAYVAALRAEGVKVAELGAHPDFPDSVFIEDPALILGGCAIMLRPGADSRRGEADALRPQLAPLVDDLIDLPGTGAIEGGDILCSDDEVLVGLSARTDVKGAEALRGIAADFGYRLRILETPPEILHFKTDCALLDSETVLATRRLSESGAFDGFRVIEVPDGEEQAANAVRINATVFLADGFPRTADALVRAGYGVRQLSVTQAALVDGGLSCMSLRYSRAQL